VPVKIQFNRASMIKAGITLLTIAIIILTPLALLLYNMETALMNPSAYKQLLIQENFYATLHQVIASQLTHELQASTDDTNRPAFINITKNSQQILMNLDQAELQGLIVLLLPIDWAQIKFENIIDQYFASMNNRIYHPNLLIAMDDIKERLIGKVGLQFFVEMIRAQPACNDQESLAWQTSPLEEVPACFPSETIIKESEPKTSELLYQIIARMPDEASLEYFFGSFGYQSNEATIVTRFQKLAAGFWKARIIIRISPIILLILLFLLGLFHKPERSFVKLWSLPVILSGLISLLMAALLVPVYRLIISNSVIPKLPAYIAPDFIGTFARIGQTAAANIAPLIAIQAILILLLGGLLYLADYVRRRRLKIRKPPTKKYTLM